MASTIRTPRLDLISMTPEFLRASLAGNLRAAERLVGLSLPEDWPDCPAFLALRLGQIEADAAVQPWLVRAIGLRSTRTMVGHIGFHTAPGAEYLAAISPGAAEFGYTVFAPFRRQGYAREAALGLMQWAREEHHVPAFIMSISPDNLPSQALAAQLGFVKIGSHIDEVDGLEEILELRASA
jgi:RimJ/RimL family protein N-acetyltransferase